MDLDDELASPGTDRLPEELKVREGRAAKRCRRGIADTGGVRIADGPQGVDDQRLWADDRESAHGCRTSGT